MRRISILAGLGGSLFLSAAARRPALARFARTDAEWRKLLPVESYEVLRHEGTERPFSSQLDYEKRPGRYHCRGCDLPLFDAATKYDSGTGWPSFWAPLPHAVATKSDATFGMVRTEVHCSRCEGHLGHVFDDGPKPTGLRYCMNGVALRFVPSASSGSASTTRT